MKASEPTQLSTQAEAVEEWLMRVGEIREHDSGCTVMLTPEMIRDYAEWVSAYQREAIAQVLEQMGDGVWAKHCGETVRRMRAEH